MTRPFTLRSNVRTFFARKRARWWRLWDSETSSDWTVEGEGFILRREDIISANVTADTVYSINNQHKTGKFDLALNDNDANLFETGLELMLMNQNEAIPIGNDALLLWLGISLTVIIMCIIVGVVTYWCKCKTITLHIKANRGDDEVEEKTEKALDSRLCNCVDGTKK